MASSPQMYSLKIASQIGGNSTNAFPTRALALAWLGTWVAEHWDDATRGKMPARTAAIAQYFPGGDRGNPAHSAFSTPVANYSIEGIQLHSPTRVENYAKQVAKKRDVARAKNGPKPLKAGAKNGKASKYAAPAGHGY